MSFDSIKGLLQNKLCSAADSKKWLIRKSKPFFYKLVSIDKRSKLYIRSRPLIKFSCFKKFFMKQSTDANFKYFIDSRFKVQLFVNSWVLPLLICIQFV